VTWIGAQLGAKLGRDGRRDAGLDVFHASADGGDLRRGEQTLGGFAGELQRVQALVFAGEIARIEAGLGEGALFLGREIEDKAAPAFVAEADELAIGGDEEGEFLLRELGVGDVELHAEIKPIDSGFADIESDLRGERIVTERGELGVEPDFVFGGQIANPFGECGGEVGAERSVPLVRVDVPGEAELREDFADAREWLASHERGRGAVHRRRPAFGGGEVSSGSGS
jgi:hypothetical protein